MWRDLLDLIVRSSSSDPWAGSDGTGATNGSVSLGGGPGVAMTSGATIGAGAG